MKLLWFSLLSILVFPVQSSAHDTSLSLCPVKLVSVYDGDTIKVTVPGWPSVIGEKISVRIRGIDTPEIRRVKCPDEKVKGLEARDRLTIFLSNAKAVCLYNVGRDKYFRLLADVYADDKDVAETLIANDLAVLYDGGTKTNPWCPETISGEPE